MLYVGTCHPVAKLGVTWLVRHVLPLLHAQASQGGFQATLTVRIVGNGWKRLRSVAPFAEWANSGVLVFLGKLSDEELAEEYARARLFVSPGLNATGIATKNFHAMASGLPVLTTSMGTAGLLLPTGPPRLCCGEDSTEAGGAPRCHFGVAELKAAAALGSPWQLSAGRPTLAQDCASNPARLECAAYAAATGGAQPDGRGTAGQVRRRTKKKARHKERQGRRKLLQMRAAARPATLHASGVLLVADEPRAFADAATRALRDDALWARLSAAGLRHQQSLSPARQASALARALVEGALQPHLPAERACVVACDSCESGPRRAALLSVLAQLLRLRIAPHVLLLPEATQPAAELAVTGSTLSAGVHFYAGTAREQWTAALAAEPVPPLSFAVALPHVEHDVARQLRHPQCAMTPPGTSCDLARIASLHELAEAPAVRRALEAEATVASDGVNDVPMLRLLGCMHAEHHLPLVLLPGARLDMGLRGASDVMGLTKVFAAYELALLQLASVVVARSEAEVAALREGSRPRDLPSMRVVPLAPHAADDSWTLLLADALGIAER